MCVDIKKIKQKIYLIGHLHGSDLINLVNRNIYGGAVGYIGWNDNMDMAIAIRTAVIKKNKLHVQAGGGVVADSDPQMEWEETMNKARAIIRAAERLGDN